MTSYRKSDSVSRCVVTYLKNIPVKFHPDPIWNDGALQAFEDGRPNKKNKNNNEMSSDIRSVPDLRMHFGADVSVSLKTN